MSKYLVFSLGCLSTGTALKQQSTKINFNNHECGTRPTPFSEFVQKYGRNYKIGSEEYYMRESTFSERAEVTWKHNCDDDRPWKAGINHLSDWTEAELQGLLGHKGSRRTQATGISERPMFASLRDNMMVGRRNQADSFPSEYSWANLTSIEETWDQGNCGSCWAVAATTVMRARAEIKGLSRQFSASQIIACTPNPNACGGTGGCEGATAELAYEYVLRAGLVGDDESFHKLGGYQTRCPAQTQVATEKATDGVVEADGTETHLLPSYETNMRGREIGMTGWAKLPENKESPLIRALVETGPIYVAVAAGSGWFTYAEGVLTPSACDSRNVVNHAVVLYGFGIKQHTRIGDVKYWHIKNSWGRGWGEEGSIRLQRLDEEESFCGWDHSPQEGSGCKDGPSKVWVCGSCGILYDAVMPTFGAVN